MEHLPTDEGFNVAGLAGVVLYLFSCALRRPTARDSDVRLLLEEGMSRETGRKLMRVNARLSAQAGQT